MFGIISNNMKKLIYLLFLLPFLSFSQSSPIDPEAVYTDLIQSLTTNGDLAISGDGSGVPSITDGLKLNYATASTLAYLNSSKVFTSLANSTGYLYNNGSGTFSYATPTSVSFGTANQIPYVNSGGTDFDYFTPGTGVRTALGVNVGSAGAFVVNGGALGTPSSGTVTNLTGTASININGTVGATTPNTGVFTQADVDNININGNTIISTDTNGSIFVEPNGSGVIRTKTILPSATSTYTIGQSGSIFTDVWSTNIRTTQLLPFVSNDPITIPTTGYLVLAKTTNQLLLGSTNTVTINSAAPSASRVYTIPDFGDNDTFVGLSATQTLTNKTLTAPKFASANFLADVNGNEWLEAPTTVASAVNHLKVTNAATGNRPKIEAVGGDTNIGVEYVTKGNLPHVFTGNGIRLVPSGGTESVFQTWKDATPTKAVGIGMNVPGAGAITDDLIMSTYDGAIWTERLNVSNANGYINIQGVYDETDASAANVFVASDGSLRRSTSSLRYKKDVETLSISDSVFSLLRPVRYASKKDTTENPLKYIGFIAEEVDSIGIKELVVYNEEGDPDALQYGQFTALNTLIIQRLMTKIQELEARIEELEQ